MGMFAACHLRHIGRANPLAGISSQSFFSTTDGGGISAMATSVSEKPSSWVTSA
jgi:hypothetical protein